MLRKVYLEGEIAEKFGSEFSIRANSLKEVFSFLETHFDGFKKYLIECEERGIGFMFNINDKYLNKEDELFLKYKGSGDIVITAMPAGAKSGIAKIFAAIAIIVFAYYMPVIFGAAGSTAGFATTGGMFLAQMTAVSIGLSLAMAGIQQLMAPDPSTDSQADESYVFQGAGQTIIEGDPVPVMYGRLRVPGRPISFRVKNATQYFEDFDPLTTDSVTPDGGGEQPDNGSPDNTTPAPGGPTPRDTSPRFTEHH